MTDFYYNNYHKYDTAHTYGTSSTSSASNDISAYNDRLFYNYDISAPTNVKAKKNLEEKKVKPKAKKKSNPYEIFLNILSKNPMIEYGDELQAAIISESGSEIDQYLSRPMYTKRHIYVSRYHYLTTGQRSIDTLLTNAFDVVIISDILEYISSMLAAANLIKRGLGATKYSGNHSYLLVLAKNKDEVKRIADEKGYPLTTAGYRIIEADENKKVGKNKTIEKAHYRYRFMKGYNHSELNTIMRFARVKNIYQPEYLVGLIKLLEKVTNCTCLTASNKAQSF